MPRPSVEDTPLYLAVVAVGVLLVALARWAAARGARWETWVALRVGDVLFTELVGAFLIGAGIGGVLAPRLEPAPASGPPRGPGPGVRFGGLSWGQLPFLLGILAAVIDVLVRVDVASFFLRGSSPHQGLVAYMGADARVVSAIPAGGYGDIVVRDGSGNPLSVAATADTDIPEGAMVRIAGRRGANPVVIRAD